MTTKNEAIFTKDLANKKMVVKRQFDAPVEQVWKAWTESELLDQWWAPRPWKAETKTMDFSEGGRWLYSMIGPERERHWSCVDYKTIVAGKQFTAVNSFCDENGNTNENFPSMHWKNDFQSTDSGTTVMVEIIFTNQSDMDKLLAMGFQQGFAMGLGNLEELLSE